jgi:hypothetical protein
VGCGEERRWRWKSERNQRRIRQQQGGILQVGDAPKIVRRQEEDSEEAARKQRGANDTGLA